MVVLVVMRGTWRDIGMLVMGVVVSSIARLIFLLLGNGKVYVK